MYLNASEGLGQIPTTLQPRNLISGSGYAFGPAPSAMEGFGQPSPPTQQAGPVFDVQCPAPAGCHPVAAEQCRPIVRQAIREAIKLANNASLKLDAAIKVEPSLRDAEAKNTARLFQFFFGHDPSHLIPWDAPHKSGASVGEAVPSGCEGIAERRTQHTFSLPGHAPWLC